MFSIANRARATSCAESRPCASLVCRVRRPAAQFPPATSRETQGEVLCPFLASANPTRIDGGRDEEKPRVNSIRARRGSGRLASDIQLIRKAEKPV